MAKISCEDCGVDSSISANTQEEITFCPFCGSDVTVPTDDTDDDEDGDDYDYDLDVDLEDDYDED